MDRMSITSAFSKAHRDGRGALIAYLTLGHPSVEDSLKAIEIAGTSGADVIEIGWPSETPYLDGFTIRDSHRQARAAFAAAPDSPKSALAEASQVTDCPLVLMGYKHDLMTVPDVLPGCVERSEVSGVLIPDADPDELKRLGIAGQPGLFDSTMNTQQIERAARTAYDFAYVRTGVGRTGEQADLSHGDIADLARRIRLARPDLPVAIGFGLSTPEDVARCMALGFDGAIVGSAIVRHVDCRDWSGLALFISELAASTFTATVRQQTVTEMRTG